MPNTTVPATAEGMPKFNRAAIMQKAWERYRNGLEQFNALPDEEATDDQNDLWKDPWKVLAEWDQPCVSRDGAIAAIKLAMYEEVIGESQLPAPMMRAALSYLEGAPA